MSRSQRRERLCRAMERIQRRHELAVFLARRKGVIDRMLHMREFIALYAATGSHVSTPVLLNYIFSK